jgi:hypothetical protein
LADELHATAEAKRSRATMNGSKDDTAGPEKARAVPASASTA